MNQEHQKKQYPRAEAGQGKPGNVPTATAGMIVKNDFFEFSHGPSLDGGFQNGSFVMSGIFHRREQEAMGKLWSNDHSAAC